MINRSFYTGSRGVTSPLGIVLLVALVMLISATILVTVFGIGMDRIDTICETFPATVEPPGMCDTSAGSGQGPVII